MNPEENPPAEPVSDQRSDNPEQTPTEPASPSSQPVEANLVQAQPVEIDPAEVTVANSDEIAEATVVPEADVVAEANLVGKPGKQSATMIPLASNLENMATSGGAVGSLVLGIWCVLGSLITSFSIINGIIGLLMGGWGLMSRKRKTTWVGIGLCLIGIGMCIVQVGTILSTYVNAIDESAY